MQVHVDQAGRIVIPKPMRERLGQRKNSKLELEENAGRLILKPVQQKGGLVRRNGRLVHTGTPIDHIDWDNLVNDMREERIREIGGW